MVNIILYGLGGILVVAVVIMMGKLKMKQFNSDDQYGSSRYKATEDRVKAQVTTKRRDDKFL